MSEALVTLTIDGIEVTVPEGTLIVDAAKQAGITIPVFCYHPKLKPVGMCRLCLVEIGRPGWDREKNAPMLDENGNPVIQFGPNLETACTTPVGDGWEVRVESGVAQAGRKQIIEYILTSHPLDCPVCDKGGECPLQNLTMGHGPGTSRFIFDEKMHLEKHVPLGELIFLDRERCIQCGRCVRYQDEIVGQPVIGFKERGRALEIVTYSNPGFDSYFSGNTTDICPVGALTTADFRFGARPWELHSTASICSHCPVGCNLMLNTRREAKTGGLEVVKRVMPRQNEWVNELWICDKGRFAHHYTHSPERVTKPLVRKRGKLVEASWDEALNKAAKALKDSDKAIGIAGGRASNEDLYVFRSLIEKVGGRVILDDSLAGGDVVRQVGLGSGSNLSQLGVGDAVLVVASDLHEEAPLWWLRIKQASKRGASLVVANGRPTKLDAYANHVVRYAYPQAAQTVLGFLNAVTKQKGLSSYAKDKDIQTAGGALADAENLVVFYGGEGLTYEQSEELALACGSLIQATGRAGKSNNGLVAVWPRQNTQGAWDMGLRPEAKGLASALKKADALYVLAADPLGDDPDLVDALKEDTFIVVQELFLTKTARQADVVFPAASPVEREGTYTSGERRVQRTYTALPARGESLSDWRILMLLGGKMGYEFEADSISAVFTEIGSVVPDYAAVSYEDLANYEPQWPDVGDEDLYFGGNAFKNHQGTGVQLASAAERGEAVDIAWKAPLEHKPKSGLLLVPVAALYDHGTTVVPSEVLHARLAPTQLHIHPEDAAQIGVADGSQVELRMNGRVEEMRACIDDDVVEGVILLPRSLDVVVSKPVYAKVKPLGKRE
jgi:NADH-quinone oxidoreductase subunit G